MTHTYTDSQRLAFLHSTNKDAEGYEYGVVKVRYGADNRRSWLWTLSDHSDVDAAMQATGIEPPAEPQPVASVEALATALIEHAAAAGLVVTIERRPLKPLAMGHAEYVIETRPARVQS